MAKGYLILAITLFIGAAFFLLEVKRWVLWHFL